jgi:hypothetical protein
MTKKEYGRARRWIYNGTLLLAVASGVSLAVVPALRLRLLDRIFILKTAITGETKPDITPIGENDIPYPEEFLRSGSAAVGSRPPAETVQKRLIIAQPGAPSITPPVLLGAADSGSAAESEENDGDSPRFQQGEIEREAYEKTLASNEKLAAAVQGGDHELSFKTWGAAPRDGGVYWVRVIFRNASGADVEYIWQTDVSSGKTSPLNFNARSF